MSDFYVDRTLYDGRPSDGRQQKELDCYDLLERLGIEYRRVDHSPADSIEDCRAVEGVIGVHICKNLFLCNRQQTDYYLLMMPGDKPFKTSEFSRQLGISRVSFGSAEAMGELLNLTPGSVSIMGLMYDRAHRVKLCIDGEVARGEYVRCHPNLNTSTLKIKTRDLFERLLPALGHRPTFVELGGLRPETD